MMEKEVRVKKPRRFKGFVLAADVGATWTKIGVYGVKGRRPSPLFIFTYRSQKIKGLLKPVREVLDFARKEYGIKVKAAGLGVAGIVDYERERCWLTNGRFWVDAKELKRKSGLKKIVMHNDFVANGYAVALLDRKNPRELVQLPHPKNYFPKGAMGENMACIGAGSGIGHCVICRHSNKYIPFASEAGHIDFPATDEFEWKLVKWMEKKQGMKTFYENFVSGPGIVNLYSYLREKKFSPATKYTKEIDSIKDIAEKSMHITKYCRKDKTCRKAVELFIKFYARDIRNYALAVLAKSGVYIAGGIAPGLVKEFKRFNFMKEFENNKTYAKTMREIPVYVVTFKEVGLLGAAVSAVSQL